MGILQGKPDRRSPLAVLQKLLGMKQSTQNNFIYGDLGKSQLSISSIYKYDQILAESNHKT